MAKVKFTGNVFLIIIMILSVVGSAISIEVEAEPVARSATNGLTPHEPIYIERNSHFATKAVTESWAGEGTEGNPYIIGNYDINAGLATGDRPRAGIKVKDTDIYFIIRNCVIHDGESNYNYGIYFRNVTNGKIENCEIYNNVGGIYIDYSLNNNQITSNRIYNNYWGIVPSSSSNNNITSNLIYNNKRGILLSSSSNNNISSNYIYNNERGIWFLLSSNNGPITANHIYNNSDGVYLQKSLNNKIHYNNIYNNTNHGIYNYNPEITYQASATYNWWGSASGPYHSNTNPSGLGDNVSDNVLYNPWLTEPAEGVSWQLPEDEEEGAPKKEKEGKPPEGFNILYILGIGTAVAAGIIIAVFLLRRRAAIPKPEIPAPKPELIHPQIPTLTLRCPQCKSTFKVESKEKPFKVKCPSCGKEGMIK